MNLSTVDERPEMEHRDTEVDLTHVLARRSQLHLEAVWLTVYRLKLFQPDELESAESYFGRHLAHTN